MIRLELFAAAVAVAVCWVASLAGECGAEGVRTTHPAQNSCTQPEGKRPYEMDWAGRTEDTRLPLTGFEDLSGWTVECSKGVTAEFVRTREQLLFGRYTARLSYKGGAEGGDVVLRPPAGIPLPAEFDCLNAWVYGNNWEWAADPTTPRVDVSVLSKGGDGVECEIPLCNVRWKEWWLAHHRLTSAEQSALAGGSFTGIIVRGIRNTEERSIFFDNLVFYKEALKPLEFKPRPKRGVDPFPGQTAGLNTGPGRLPFPTREETILPMQLAGRYTNRVEQVESANGPYFVFRYSGRDGEIAYTWNPREGGPDAIRATIQGETIQPMAGARVVLDGDPTLRFREFVRKGNCVRAVYDAGGNRVEWTVRIWQKSLVVDCVCAGGNANALDFGRFSGLKQPDLVFTPYLTLGGGNNPAILVERGGRRAFFGSVWADWYRSNGSELYADVSCQPTTARVNGGVRYNARTDGHRNGLFERIFVTVSPTFEECYPSVANPPASAAKAAGSRLWQESWGPEKYADAMTRGRMLASYGITELIQCNHEITWRDGGESFTLRTRSAPGRGGDEALKDYVRHQRSLGWREGLYTNYTDYAPVNGHWDEDAVQRDGSGEWRPAWARNYGLKPSRAVEFDSELAPQVQAKFGTDAAYTDVQTAVSPWQYNDYDARVPGAGTFAATFYAYGELLLNDQKVYGIVHSEGTYHWMYAGLATGNYGICYAGIDAGTEPLNVAFDLYQIHPREADIGMGWTSYIFRNIPDWDKPENIESSVDHFLAATLAYGHIGWLVEEEHGISQTCRSYYMLRPVTAAYAGVAPERVEYADSSGRLASASEAIAKGFFNLSRLHVRYHGGLELYVNGSGDVWRVQTPEGAVELPRWGWAAWSKDGGLYETSALADGKRADYCRNSFHEYLDGRGHLQRRGGLAASGGVARLGDVFIDTGGNKEIGFRAGKACGGKMEALDPDGKRLGECPLRSGRDGWLWFNTMDGARRYRFVSGKASGPALSSARWQVTPGEAVSVSATGAAAGKVNVRIPGTAVPGEHIWVNALGGALDFDVVKPLDLSVGEASPSGKGGLRLPVLAVSHMAGQAKVSVEVVEAKGVTGIFQPSAPAVSRAEGWLVFSPLAGAATDASAVVLARCGSVEEKHGLSFTTGQECPVLVDLLASGSYWDWASVTRDGKVTKAPTDSGASWLIGTYISGGVAKPGIFSHPPYEHGVGAVYGESRVFELPQGVRFHCWAGLKDGGAESDGVVYSVWVLEDRHEPVQVARLQWKEHRWTELQADLSKWAGRRIRLRLMADVGPADNSQADWAVWGEPCILPLDGWPGLRLR